MGWSYKAGVTVYNYRSSGVISEVVSDGGGRIKQGPLYITIGQIYNYMYRSNK